MGDAESAYLQVPLPEDAPKRTWVRLPAKWWPETWRHRFRDPMVPLRRAVYGHVEAGALWEQYLARKLGELGWEPLEAMPEFWVHKQQRMGAGCLRRRPPADVRALSHWT